MKQIKKYFQNSKDNGFILIDCLYAVLILSMALFSIITFQSIIAKNNKNISLKNYSKSNLALLQNIKNNISNEKMLNTNNKVYNANAFSTNNIVSIEFIEIK